LEMSNKANSENDVILEISNYEEFSWIDSSLQCYNGNEDCEEAVVEEIAAKRQKTSEDQETDEDDTTDRERVTNDDRRKFIAWLRPCFMQEGDEGSPTSALETCADSVQLQSFNRTRKGALDQFLQSH
jgi:hypothetical protein